MKNNNDNESHEVTITTKLTPTRSVRYTFKQKTDGSIDLPASQLSACQRPLPLISRLVRTHSNPNDLVVDFFSGYGTTGIVAHHLGRRFLGCELIPEDAVEADRRVTDAKRYGRVAAGKDC